MVMMNTGCRQMRDPPADRRKQGKPQPIEPLEVPDGLLEGYLNRYITS